MFSGGDYEEVARWLKNFLTSHAKREDPRMEILFEAGDERAGRSYAARVVFDGRLSAPVELDFPEVRDRRGGLAWCQALAQRTRAAARAILTGSAVPDTAAR